MDPRPACHYLAEDDEDEQVSGGLNQLLPRNAGGAPWTWKKISVVVDSRAAENVMPKSIFPDISTDETKRSKHGVGFKGTRRRAQFKNYEQQVIFVRTLEGFVSKSTWQVADATRLLVSASHVIQAGNDLFIGKAEAYIMNRKKKEKSMLRKEGNVYVVDLFVKAP